MILWNTNFNLDEDILKDVVSKVTSDPQCEAADLGLHSTYFVPRIEDRAEVTFVEHYKNAIGEGLTALGLQHRCSYVFDHWLQVYGEGNVGHGAHDHYSNRTVISWVHFLNPSEDKAFHFIDSNHNKVYPQQNAGDFIMFNPWMLHGVEPCPAGRYVIAGNVHITELVSPSNRTVNLYHTFDKETYICKEIDAVL